MEDISSQRFRLSHLKQEKTLRLFSSPEEAAKESFRFGGKSRTPVVAISDASGGAGGLLLLAVTLEDVNLTMLRAIK